MSDDLNDVRAAIGAQGHALKLAREEIAALKDQLDDQGALLARLAPLAEFLLDVKRVVEVDVPAAIEKLATDPMLGAIIGPYAGMLGDTLRGGLSRAKADRTNPPAVEG